MEQDDFFVYFVCGAYSEHEHRPVDTRWHPNLPPWLLNPLFQIMGIEFSKDESAGSASNSAPNRSGSTCSVIVQSSSDETPSVLLTAPDEIPAAIPDNPWTNFVSYFYPPDEGKGEAPQKASGDTSNASEAPLKEDKPVGPMERPPVASNLPCEENSVADNILTTQLTITRGDEAKTSEQAIDAAQKEMVAPASHAPATTIEEALDSPAGFQKDIPQPQEREGRRELSGDGSERVFETDQRKTADDFALIDQKSVELAETSTSPSTADEAAVVLSTETLRAHEVETAPKGPTNASGQRDSSISASIAPTAESVAGVPHVPATEILPTDVLDPLEAAVKATAAGQGSALAPAHDMEAVSQVSAPAVGSSEVHTAALDAVTLREAPEFQKLMSDGGRSLQHTAVSGTTPPPPLLATSSSLLRNDTLVKEGSFQKLHSGSHQSAILSSQPEHQALPSLESTHYASTDSFIKSLTNSKRTNSRDIEGFSQLSFHRNSSLNHSQTPLSHSQVSFGTPQPPLTPSVQCPGSVQQLDSRSFGTSRSSSHHMGGNQSFLPPATLLHQGSFGRNRPTIPAPPPVPILAAGGRAAPPSPFALSGGSIETLGHPNFRVHPHNYPRQQQSPMVPRHSLSGGMSGNYSSFHRSLTASSSASNQHAGNAAVNSVLHQAPGASPSLPLQAGASGSLSSTQQGVVRSLDHQGSNIAGFPASLNSNGIAGLHRTPQLQ